MTLTTCPRATLKRRNYAGGTSRASPMTTSRSSSRRLRRKPTVSQKGSRKRVCRSTLAVEAVAAKSCADRLAFVQHMLAELIFRLLVQVTDWEPLYDCVAADNPTPRTNAHSSRSGGSSLLGPSIGCRRPCRERWAHERSATERSCGDGLPSHCTVAKGQRKHCRCELSTWHGLCRFAAV